MSANRPSQAVFCCDHVTVVLLHNCNRTCNRRWTAVLFPTRWRSVGYASVHKLRSTSAPSPTRRSRSASLPALRPARPPSQWLPGLAPMPPSPAAPPVAAPVRPTLCRCTTLRWLWWSADLAQIHAVGRGTALPSIMRRTPWWAAWPPDPRAALRPSQSHHWTLKGSLLVARQGHARRHLPRRLPRRAPAPVRCDLG